jgi:hypothetical protein
MEHEIENEKMCVCVCVCVGGEQRGRKERLQSPVPHKRKMMAMEREYYIRLSGVVVASFDEEQTRY